MEELSSSELSRLQTMSLCEKRIKAEGFFRIAGVDEAGRGPLAGPVVAAACILSDNVLFPHLNDSKLLTPESRNALFDQITTSKHVEFGIGIIEMDVIDQINILQATFLAMRKAIVGLHTPPDYILIDGNQIPLFDIPSESVVQGDRLSVSIAAASIIAKVTRDRIMEKLDEEWPQYGFKRHKGYATEEHLKAIDLYGPCPAHRKSFDPVKSILNPQPVQIELF